MSIDDLSQRLRDLDAALRVVRPAFERLRAAQAELATPEA